MRTLGIESPVLAWNIRICWGDGVKNRVPPCGLLPEALEDKGYI